MAVLSTAAPWAHCRHHLCYKSFGHQHCSWAVCCSFSHHCGRISEKLHKKRPCIYLRLMGLECPVHGCGSIALKPGWTAWCEKHLVLWEVKAERRRSRIALQSQRLHFLPLSSTSWKFHQLQTAPETTDQIVNLWPLGNIGEPNHNKGVIELHLFLTSNITSGIYHEESGSKQEVSWFSRQYHKCWIWKHPHQTRAGIQADQPH